MTKRTDKITKLRENTNSVEINQIDWAEEFALKHYTELETETKEGALNFARSIILYKRKDYDKALEILNKTKLSQFLFRLSIKTFYLRIYYEKGDFQSAGFALDSYKQFLYKNKTISEAYRNVYLNFAAIYNDLLRAASGEKMMGKNELTTKIESMSPNVYNNHLHADTILPNPPDLQNHQYSLPKHLHLTESYHQDSYSMFCM